VTFIHSLDKRRLPIQIGISLTFALVPLWYRLPYSPFLSELYVTRFLILLPVVWTIGAWLFTGVPGLAEFLRDSSRARWGLCLLLLALWAYSSQSWAFMRALQPQVGATAALQFCLMVLFALVVACVGLAPRAIIGALAFGVLWNALITFGQTANQGSLGLTALGEFRLAADSPGVSVVVAGDVRWLRPYALLPHPNVLAGFFVIGLLALVAWITGDRRERRWLGTLLFLAGFWALLLTFSRAAWVGFAAGLFALYPLIRPYLKSRWRHVLVSGGLILITGLAFALLYRPLLGARAGEGTENVELRSVSDRAVYTHFGLAAAGENFLVGVGIGNFPWRASYYLYETDFDLRGDNVHHVLLSAWAELGVVGFVLVVGALVCGVEVALRAIKHEADGRERACLLAGTLALGIIGLFDHYPWTMLHMQVAWWGLLAAALGVPT
jgi:O-antigen ligase